MRKLILRSKPKKNPSLILLTGSVDFVVCLILGVLRTLRNLIQVVNDVGQTVVLLASPCSCNAPHPAKTDHLVGEGEKEASCLRRVPVHILNV